MGQCNIPALPQGVTYTQACAGCYDTVLLKSDGTVAIAGSMLHPASILMAGLPEGVTYTQAATGVMHTILLKSDGTAAAFGCNRDGQCNIPALPEGVTYTQAAAGILHTVLLKSDGTAAAFGDMKLTSAPSLPCQKE